MTLIEDLKWRGLIKDISSPELEEKLNKEAKIKDEKILRFVNNTKDYYPFEEERRLFYVALTRTKTYCYLLVPYEKESIFIREIKKYHQYIEIFKT